MEKAYKDIIEEFGEECSPEFYIKQGAKISIEKFYDSIKSIYENDISNRGDRMEFKQHLDEIKFILKNQLYE